MPPQPGPTPQDEFRLTALINNGPDGGGRVYTSVQRRRLAFIAVSSRERGESQTWLVDGVPRASRDDAEQALQQPPVLSEDEQAMLANIGPEWRSGNALIGGAEHAGILPDTPEARNSAALTTLTDKGMLEWRDGMVRLLASA